MDELAKYLDPRTLASLQGLDLQARMAVEGYVAGLHKSPYHGFSVEFAEHREYVPGDDLRHMDWKVWSKTDKWYLKQYEEETNLLTLPAAGYQRDMAYASADNVSEARLRQVHRRRAGLPGAPAAGFGRPGDVRRQGRALPPTERPAVAPEGPLQPDECLARGREDRHRRDLSRPGRTVQEARGGGRAFRFI